MLDDGRPMVVHVIARRHWLHVRQQSLIGDKARQILQNRACEPSDSAQVALLIDHYLQVEVVT